MGIIRLDHVGITVTDLDEAVAFFEALGLRADPPSTVEGEWVGRVNGLGYSSAEIVGLRYPDGNGWLELSRFVVPVDDTQGVISPPNRAGIRHVCFAVDDVNASVAAVRASGYELIGELVDYNHVYRLCYVRGPDGIIVELAEEL